MKFGLIFLLTVFLVGCSSGPDCSNYELPECTDGFWVNDDIDCSGSMEPFISCGDSVAAFPYEESDYHVGVCDVVVYERTRAEGDLILHRIVEVNSGGSFKTKGDSTKYVDAYRPTESEIRWVVCK